MGSSARVEEALAAVEDLHMPSPDVAGEYTSGYSNGLCAYCRWATIPLLRRYKGHLNGGSKKVWMHDHPTRAPHCTTCSDGYETVHAWPCPTWEVLAVLRTALGLPARDLDGVVADG